MADIKQFEASISELVFVLGNENHNLPTIRIANKRCENHIQVGFLTVKNGEAHYSLIKTLPALVSSQISNHAGKN